METNYHVNRDIVIDFIEELKNSLGSTTSFLEKKRDSTLMVKVLFQKMIEIDQQIKLLRYSILHFGDAEQGVILSICQLNINRLQNAELNKLLKGNIPIGKTLDTKNIKKKTIEIKLVKSMKFARMMKTKTHIFNSKKYELYENDRYVGLVKEIFNKESIRRALK